MPDLNDLAHGQTLNRLRTLMTCATNHLPPAGARIPRRCRADLTKRACFPPSPRVSPRRGRDGRKFPGDRRHSNKPTEVEQAWRFLSLTRDRHGRAKPRHRSDRALLLTRSDWRPLTQLAQEYLLSAHRSRPVAIGIDLQIVDCQIVDTRPDGSVSRRRFRGRRFARVSVCLERDLLDLPSEGEVAPAFIIRAHR
jgi:hypothetical protein